MTKSEDWDSNGGRPIKFNPLGNFKLMILVGIVLIIVTLAIAMSFPPAYAYTGDCDRLSVSEQGYYSLTKCYLKSIFDQNEIILKNQFVIAGQNESIIEKLDWNNCVLDLKNSHYNVSRIRILNTCGDMP